MADAKLPEELEALIDQLKTVLERFDLRGPSLGIECNSHVPAVLRRRPDRVPPIVVARDQNESAVRSPVEIPQPDKVPVQLQFRPLASSLVDDPDQRMRHVNHGQAVAVG